MEFWIKFGRVSYPEASRNIINEDNEAAVPILLIRDNVILPWPQIWRSRTEPRYPLF